MTSNGGIYGDYEFASTATRVLENRRYAHQIYKKRVEQSKGSCTALYLSSLSSLFFFTLGSHFCSIKEISCPKQKCLNSIGVGLLGGFVTYGFLTSLLSDSQEGRYLRENKSDLIKMIDERLNEDHKERSGVYPEVENSTEAQ